jgi:hypothetical protein
VFVLALFGLLALQYLTPRTLVSVWDLNRGGVDHFRQVLGVSSARLDVGSYRVAFSFLAGAIWIALAAFLYLAFGRGPRVLGPRARRLITGVAVCCALGLALLWPASFSNDVYAYVGYGRLAALFGKNPYLTTQRALIDLGDATGPFLTWHIRSPYGPLWTVVSTAVVWLLRGAGLFAQVLGMKLIAAAAGLMLARAGSTLAERIEAGRRDLTFAALAFNPLFLIEGAGNGHNDVVMMAIVLLALLALAAERLRVAAVLVGCAAAVKFVPLLLGPWIVVRAARDASSPRRALSAAGVVVALLLAPIAVAYLPFWSGIETLSGLGQRWSYAQSADHRPGLSVVAGVLAIAAYAALSWWMVRRADPRRWVTGWAILAGALVIATGDGLFPWYLAWPWSVTLVRWDRRYLGASLFLLALALFLTLRYAILPP